MERKITYLENNTILTTLIYGPKIFLDTRDSSLAPIIIQYGCWEKWVTDVFLSLVKQGMTVLDIGANCGYYSLLAAQAVGSSGQVHCVEPNPFLHNNLTRSFLINGYNQVKLHKVAFSDKEGEVFLYSAGDFSGGATIYEIPSSYTAYGAIKKVKVPAVNFAKYFPNIKAHVIKIDIQGAEPHLVDGLLKIAEKSGTLDILIEYAPVLWIVAGFNPKSVLQRFTNNKFSIEIINQNGTLKKVSLDQLISITKKMETAGGFVDLRLSRRV